MSKPIRLSIKNRGTYEVSKKQYDELLDQIHENYRFLKISNGKNPYKLNTITNTVRFGNADVNTTGFVQNGKIKLIPFDRFAAFTNINGLGKSGLKALQEFVYEEYLNENERLRQLAKAKYLNKGTKNYKKSLNDYENAKKVAQNALSDVKKFDQELKTKQIDYLQYQNYLIELYNKMDLVNKLNYFDKKYTVEEIRNKVIDLANKINNNQMIDQLLNNRQRDSFKGWAISPYGRNMPKSVNQEIRRFKETDLLQNSKGLVKKIFRWRIEKEQDIENKLKETYIYLKKNGGKAFKIAISFGYVLRYQKNDSNGQPIILYNVHNAGENDLVFKKAKPIVRSNLEYMNLLNNAKLSPLDLSYVVDNYTAAVESGAEVVNLFGMQIAVWITDFNLGAQIALPEWIIKSDSFYSLLSGSHGVYDDNLCFWRALAIGLRDKKPKDCTAEAKKLALHFYPENIKQLKPTQQVKQYEGIDVKEDGLIEKIEDYYECAISIIELFDKKETNPVSIYEGNPKYSKKINMAVYDRHIVYQVKSTDIILKKLKCEKCEYVGSSCKALNQHYQSDNCNAHSDEKTIDDFTKNPELCLSKDNKIKWMIDNYAPDSNLNFIYKYLIVYDFEACLVDLQEKHGESTIFVSKHVPISVCVVDGFNRTPTVLKNADPFALINDFCEEITKRRVAIIMEMKKEFEPLLKVIENEYGLMKDFDKWIEKTPVLGYNSSFYDASLLIEYGLFHILTDDIQQANEYKKTDGLSAIKKGSRYAQLQSNKFKFLDIGSYQAPMPLEAYIKAYNDQTKTGGQNKYPFMYEQIKSYADLNTYGMLSPDDLEKSGITGEKLEQYYRDIAFDSKKTYRYFKIQDFHSKLKPSTEEEYKKEYEIFKQAWINNKCKTWMDYLEFYNKQDVLPLLIAFDNQRKYYEPLGLDLVSDGISLPSIATNIMYQFGHNKKDLSESWQSYLKSLMSVINSEVEIENDQFNDAFHLAIVSRVQSYKEQDDKRNEKKPYKDFSKITTIDIKKILCRDSFSCVYCSTNLDISNFSMDRMNCDKNHNYKNCVSSCTDCNKSRSNTPFLKVLYNQFVQKYYQSKKSDMIQLFDENNKSGFYLLKKNMVGGPSIVFHHYHEVGKTYIKNSKNIMKKGFGYDANALYPYCLSLDMPTGRCKHLEKNLTDQNEIKEYNKYLTSDKFAGFIEIDIETPEELKEQFKEFPPIFKNTEIDTAVHDIGEFNKNKMKEMGIKDNKSKKLISTYGGKNILVNKSLYKWYLNHGLIISKIHSVLEYEKELPIFKSFVDTIADNRRLGDTDKTKKSFADEYKLIGNSAVGYTIIDKSKHKAITYTNDITVARRAIQSKNFVDLNEMTNNNHDDIYEIQKQKTKIKQDTSLQVGITVYMYAKLRMLEFYHDFLIKYHEYDKFQMCYMDTDSMYMALGENSLRECIKPNTDMNEYNKAEQEFMVLKGYKDSRTPGAFKIEMEYDGIVALCPKLYYCKAPEGKDNKFSSKGINKKLNKDILNFDYFADSLFNSKKIEALNKGFKINVDSENKTKNMITYETHKVAKPMSLKRIVENDGISTRPLDI